jgi:hypothetical protein
MGFSPKKLWKTWRLTGAEASTELGARELDHLHLSLERMGKTWGKPGKIQGKLGKFWENHGKSRENWWKMWKILKNGVVLLGKNMKTSNIYGGLLGKSSRIIFNWRESWENYQTEWKHGDNSGKNTVFFILWDISWDYDGRIWENGIRIMRNKVGKNTLFCL